MGAFDNYVPAVVQALQTRGLSGDCPTCKKNTWVVHGVPVTMPVYEASGELKFPQGTSMPLAALICRNCGWVGFFSLGALGLIRQPGQPAEGTPAAPAATPPAAPETK